jgi:hypothetical protein
MSTTPPATADDHQDGEYKTDIPYAKQNNNLLQEQLKNAAIRPLQYYPLPQLREEISAIIVKLNDNSATEQDTAQLAHLLACLEVNPEHKAEVAEEERLWAEQVRDRAEEWLLETRAFVPPFIVSATERQLIDECGYSKALAKRLLTKKCLWLVRMQEHDIAKLHFADLSVAYGFQGQRLDLVEIGAIFAVCQSIQFKSDGTREKAKWKEALLAALKSLMKQESLGKLTSAQLRNPAYTDMEPGFAERLTLFERNPVSSEGAHVTEKPVVSSSNGAEAFAATRGAFSAGLLPSTETNVKTRLRQSNAAAVIAEAAASRGNPTITAHGDAKSAVASMFAKRSSTGNTSSAANVASPLHHLAEHDSTL